MKESSNANPKKKKKFEVPNSLVFIFIFIVIATFLTYVVPAGQYTRVFDEVSGQDLVVPGSFTYIEQTPVSPFRMFVCIGEGFIDQSLIIFFILFAYAFVGALVKYGVFDALIALSLKKLGHNAKLLIPLVTIFFGVLGSVAGIAEEVFGLFPVVLALAIAMGYDEIVGASMIYLGVFTGFASGTMNPFSIGIAQTIAQVPMFSGVGLRIVCWVFFMSILIIYTMRYAAKIKADPTKSLMYDPNRVPVEKKDADKALSVTMTTAQKLSALVFVGVLVMTVVGALVWKWYMAELTALFFAATLLVGIINRRTPNQIADDFIASCSETTFSILCIGFAGTIAYVMNQGNIIDTILYYMANLLNQTTGYVTALMMLVVQTLLNFFIPAGPAMAAVSMPIMTPLADLTGISRQTAVLAFQFGDGYTNMFWPTMVFMMCGILKIPVAKWYRYISPLFVFFTIAQVIMMCVAVAIGY